MPKVAFHAMRHETQPPLRMNLGTKRCYPCPFPAKPPVCLPERHSISPSNFCMKTLTVAGCLTAFWSHPALHSVWFPPWLASDMCAESLWLCKLYSRCMQKKQPTFSSFVPAILHPLFPNPDTNDNSIFTPVQFAIYAVEVWHAGQREACIFLSNFSLFGLHCSTCHIHQ